MFVVYFGMWLILSRLSDIHLVSMNPLLTKTTIPTSPPTLGDNLTSHCTPTKYHRTTNSRLRNLSIPCTPPTYLCPAVSRGLGQRNLCILHEIASYLSLDHFNKPRLGALGGCSPLGNHGGKKPRSAFEPVRGRRRRGVGVLLGGFNYMRRVVFFIVPSWRWVKFDCHRPGSSTIVPIVGCMCSRSIRVGWGNIIMFYLFPLTQADSLFFITNSGCFVSGFLPVPLPRQPTKPLHCPED